MQVVIDPMTGRITPAPAQAPGAISVEHLRQLLQNSTAEGLAIERRPDGTEVMDLQGRFQHAMQIQFGADGTVMIACNVHGGHLLSLAAIRSLRSWAAITPP
jgi:hypothetical protein